MAGATFVAGFVGLDGGFSTGRWSFLFDIFAVGVIGTASEISKFSGLYGQSTTMTFGTSFSGVSLVKHFWVWLFCWWFYFFSFFLGGSFFFNFFGRFSFKASSEFFSTGWFGWFSFPSGESFL